MELKWYLARDEEQHGPYTWDDLVSFYNEGNLLADDLLWNETMAEWQRADQVTDFLFVPLTEAVSEPKTEQAQPEQPKIDHQAILKQGINIAKQVLPGGAAPPSWKVVVGNQLPQLPKELNTLKSFLNKL